MSTETTETKPAIVIPPCDIVIERNGVKLGLTNFRIVKGEDADKFYPAPAVTPSNVETVIQWIGRDTNLVNELQTLVKRKFQNIWHASFTAEGMFDEALFVKYGSDFTSAGMKLKEINDKLDELQAQLTKLIDAGDWMSSDEAKAELSALNDQVRAYRQMKEDRQRKPKAETDEAPSVEVK